jgi:Tol biopolymer transport system component
MIPACQGTEPGEGSADLPELVYAERDEGTGLWSIQGYVEDRGSRELAPGPDGAPRPSVGGLLVRPTTGELLYYSEDPGYLGHLLLDPGSGDVRRLSVPGVPLEWSPLGDLLTVVADQAILVVTLDGEVRRTVCAPTQTCGVPAWAPSGGALAVSRRTASGKPDLWLVPSVGGAETNLTQTAPASETNPSWSPDGTLIAYYKEEDFQLVVANADGTGARPLFAPITPGDFAWLPDGRAVAVRGTLDDEPGIVRVPLDGMPSLLTPPGERPVDASRLSWSPSGDRLVYLAYDGTERDYPGVFLIRPDGSDRRQLNRPGNVATDPAWIPQ